MTLIPAFETAADVQGLALAEDIEDVAGKLQAELAYYAELEMRSGGTRIDLITIAQSIDGANSFLEILGQRGATADDLGLAQQLKRFGAGKTFGLKLPIAGEARGGELYIRGAIPITEGTYFLERHLPETQGSKVRATGLLTDLAAIFDKGHTHMIAADVSSGRSMNLFLTTYLEEGKQAEDEALLERALGRIGINDASIQAGLDLHKALGARRPETLFFSWPASAGDGPARAKIDYAGVRLGLAAELMDAAGAAGQADRVLLLGQRLNTALANYAGIIVGDEGVEQARAYFTLQS